MKDRAVKSRVVLLMVRRREAPSRTMKAEMQPREPSSFETTASRSPQDEG
jgi:hypothetical protein